jgi:hypothetical protein
LAYQPQKFNETTLQHIITHTEEAAKNREDTPGTFLDIDGSFDGISFDITTKAAKQHGHGDTIC